MQRALQLLKPVVRLAGDLGLVGPLAGRCASATKELRIPGVTPASDARRILALSPVRFGGDLKSFVASGRFRLFEMPEYWQYAALNLHAESSRERRDRFLRKFAQVYLRRMNIDGVIGATFWYRQDIPWGNAAEAVGIPYIVLHKECFKPEPPQMRRTVEKALQYGKFQGRHVIVHNAPLREALVAAGYARATQVSDLGCMRMDEFVRRAASAPRPARARPLATLFSFTLGVGLDDLHVDPFPADPSRGWSQLFEQTHASFARLASQRPDADFIIKPKWRGQWTDLIEQILARAGTPLASLPNLTVDNSVSAHQLIFDSNVIVTFNSTTMLEAGLAGRPVVVPDFSEARDPRFIERVKLRDSYHLFDAADSPELFMARIAAHLDRPAVDPSGEDDRRALFGRWVSRLDATSSDRTVGLLHELTAPNR